MNHYETLGVSNTASPDEIKRAYRKLASQHHPDKGGDTAMFQKVEEAYRVLSDPQKRAEYDNPPQQMGQGHFHFNFGGGHPQELNDILSQFFGGNNPFAHARQQPRRNQDVRIEITVSLQETLTDQRKTINVRTHNNESHTIDITIPRGITSGTTIKYPGLGDKTFGNLPPGDMYATVNVLRHPNFQVSGLDLIVSLTIDCFQAIIGSEQTIAGLDGKQFVIKTPQGCQPGTKLKIAGEGLWGFQQDIKGSLFVQVNISIPTNLTESQLELVKTISTNGK